MKTIEQDTNAYLKIEDQNTDLFITQAPLNCLIIEKPAIPAFIQALLPEGKAIIDVPQFEGYEFVKVDYATTYDYVYCDDRKRMDIWGNVNCTRLQLIYRKIEKQEFNWPEHLPDGTELNPYQEAWLIKNPKTAILLDWYNLFARPEDRITIPDWLEREPRTIVKGEEV